MTRVRRFRDFAGARVFVTGAASGIGRATALRLANEGAELFLTDICEAPLFALVDEITTSGGSVSYAAPADLADHDAVAAMAAEIAERHGAMDIVMNIAGIASWGTVSAMPHEQWQRLIDVNLMGPIHVIEEFVPAMVDSGRGGHLVNVSSAAGIIGMPWHAAYSASKFGLRGVSEVLRFDLARQGIGVSLVCPGAVDTGLTETVQIAGIDKASPQFQRAQAGFRKRAVSPDQAAGSILDGIRKGRYWIYTSPDIHAVHLLQRYFPPGYTAAMRAMHAGANRVLPAVERARKNAAPATDESALR